MSGALPDEGRALLRRDEPAVLTTLMAGGRPRSWVMWATDDGGDVVMTTRDDRPQVADITADPRVSVLVYDRAHPTRYLEVRGDARVEQERATELTTLLAGQYGAAAQRSGDRVVLRITPQRARWVAWG